MFQATASRRRGGFFFLCYFHTSTLPHKKICSNCLFVVPSDVCLGFLCHTISPRIKANSPVATATLRSPYYSFTHIICKNGYTLHPIFNIPPSNEFEWNIEYRMQIDKSIFFLQIMLTPLAYVRIFLYLCAVFWRSIC